jgi:hypothetical protein
VDLSKPGLREGAERAIVRHADRLGLNAAEREARAGRLAAAVGVDYGSLRSRRVLELMTPEEMQQVAADGADIQLHTHRHRVPRDERLFSREILENRTRLERATGRAARDFCYPSGVVFPECLPWLASLGVQTATTTVAGLARADANPLLLPRVVDTASLSAIEFEGWLAGLSHLLPRRAL